MRILRAIWAGITAAKNVFTNLLFLLIVIVIILALTAQDGVRVPESGALVIDPTGFLVEQKQAIDPVAQFLTGYDEEPETRLRDVIAAIDEARDDDRIKALVLELDGLQGAGMSMLEEIGSALVQFRESTGKPVLAFAGTYNQSQYYLAAHADEVFLDSHSFPTLGGVFLTGLGVYPLYFKGALDKLNVDVHVFRAGTYKSAVEPFIRDDMSAEAQESNLRWLSELWQEYATAVVKARDISPEAFERYTNAYDELLANSADAVTLAVDQGFVDDLISREAFEERVASIVGKNGNGDYERIGFRDYVALKRPSIQVPTPGTNQIAVITAKGNILDGEQPAGSIGGETVSQLIEQARENDAVKAVVLRIDSPGGSAAAAERIRAQLALTQRAGKPVVVSMGATAASGGYWIAATANKIFALPSTITGSIGTFIVLPSIDRTLAEFGINSDGVGTTSLSGAMNVADPLNPVLERTLQIALEHTYKQFLTLVAEGREMSLEAVDEVAQGQVWSGKTALELGLVDAMGSLDDAIASAALLADVSEFEILYIERELSARERLLRELFGASAGLELPLASKLRTLSAEMQALVEMADNPGVYLQCLTCRVVQ